MHTPLPLAAFQIGHPLFGSQWLALLAVMGFIAALLASVALLGRWLAATHPSPPPVALRKPVAAPAVTPSAASPALSGDIPAEAVPVILAVVAALFPGRAHVTSIRRIADPVTPAPSLEALMQQWSYEGRRQIYSSHKVR
jgi:hypothetical protein